MCRFIAYIGKPLTLNDVLFKPANSLIKQSKHAREMDQPTNGDGFGLGWYAHDVNDTAGLFKSIRPAWNDLNLESLSKVTRSDCFLAHVRQASKGGISEFNCHPFQHEKLLFMHNGTIGGFETIKRHLRHELDDDIYNWIKGQTDSEHFFGLFLEFMRKSELHFNADNAAKILTQTLHEVENLKKEYNDNEVAKINGVVTNGKSMVACRYSSDPNAEPSTLYYACGDHYEYHDGKCHIIPSEDGQNGVVLIVSEKLTDFNAEWHEVPRDHMLQVYEDLSISLSAIPKNEAAPTQGAAPDTDKSRMFRMM